MDVTLENLSDPAGLYMHKMVSSSSQSRVFELVKRGLPSHLDRLKLETQHSVLLPAYSSYRD